MAHLAEYAWEMEAIARRNGTVEQRSLFVQEIMTECEIDAPAAKIYSIISDFANFGHWTSDITISGDTRPGGRMRVMVRDRDIGWMKLSSKMIRMDEGIIAFNNALFAPFIFFGRHRYEIIPLSENRTRFVNAEVFSGLAVPFVRQKSLLRNVREFKENMNVALKGVAEAL